MTKTLQKTLASIARRASEHVCCRSIADPLTLANSLVESVYNQNRDLPNWRIVLRLVEAMTGKVGVK